MPRLTFPLLIRAIVLLLFTAVATGHGASGQTQQFLSAPVVKVNVRVRWNPTTKTVEWEADDKMPFRAIQSDTLFLTVQSIYITYPEMNPLSIQATASAVSADDPSAATITKLISAITSVATTVGPPLPAAPAGAALPAAPVAPAVSCTNASQDIENLRTSIYGPATQPSTVTTTVQGWIGAIDSAFASGLNGPQAISAGIQKIQAAAFSYHAIAVNANAVFTTIKSCAAGAATPADQKGLYAAVSLIDINPRIQQIDSVASAANQLADLLSKQYAVPTKWMPDPVTKALTDLLISGEIAPSTTTMQNVTVKVLNVSLTVDPTTGAVATSQQAAGSAAFSVRRYSAFAPEIGIGAVFGTLTVPSYGTSTNSSGQMVVAPAKKNTVSVNPTILANFVCRCGSTVIVPMFQVGAATSTSLPAVLLGGGLRLFGAGKGDVALGGGAMFGWYKDLKTLDVGSVVTGTAQINSDLGYTAMPKLGGYLAIQYKF